MASLPFLLRGLLTKEDNEKNRKREKRNEIQCMILVRSYLVGFIRTEFCLKKDIIIIDSNEKNNFS